MDPVHPRCHEDQIQRALEPDREADIAVMKGGVRLQRQFVNREGPHRRADDDDLGNAKDRGECDLPEVKSERRRYVELRIDVMHVVESPQQWHAVIGDVPPVEGEVEQQEREEGLSGGRDRQDMDQAKRAGRRPFEGPQCGRPHENRRRCERERCGADVDRHSPYQRIRVTA
jgi:hypothetical protein